MSASRANNEIRTEQAKQLIQFFQDNGAVFSCTLKQVRGGPLINEFYMWFEFIVRTLIPAYKLCDQNRNEAMLGLLNCLDCPYPTTKKDMMTLNSPYQWPKFLAILDWLRNVVLVTCLLSFDFDPI